MRIKTHSLVVILTVLLSQSCMILEHGNREQRNMKKTVEPLVIDFMHEIPEEYLNLFDISNDAEVEKAELGTPVPVYTLENDSMVFTNTWRLAYISENEYKALLTLTRDDDGNFEVVDFGAKVLAMELANVSQLNNVQGMLRVYELQKDFFLLQNNKRKIEFYAIPYDGNRAYTLEEIIQMKNE